MSTHRSLKAPPVISLGALVLVASVLSCGCTSTVEGTAPNSSSPRSDASEGATDDTTGADPSRRNDLGTAVGEIGAAPAPVVKTYCDDVVPPPGSADFLCADFDSELLAKGWDAVSRSAGGTLDRTNSVAGSAPFALLTGVTGGPGDGALVWKRSGATPFEAVTAKVQINPARAGTVLPPVDYLLELLDIRTSNASVTFGYARGSEQIEADKPYSGYYVRSTTFGGLIRTRAYKIPTPLGADVWTELVLVWNRDGRIDLTYGGVSVLSVEGFASTDTVVSIRLGARATGDFGGPVHRFDDAELSIGRSGL